MRSGRKLAKHFSGLPDRTGYRSTPVQLIPVATVWVSCQRLPVPGAVLGTAHQLVLAPRCFPGETPPDPAKWIRGSLEFRCLPAFAPVDADLHCLDCVFPSPGKTPDRMEPGGDSGARQGRH